MEGQPKFHLNVHSFLSQMLNSIKIEFLDSSFQTLSKLIYIFLVYQKSKIGQMTNLQNRLGIFEKKNTPNSSRVPNLVIMRREIIKISRGKQGRIGSPRGEIHSPCMCNTF